MQRVVTDFAADLPFAQAMDKLVEHYGVRLDESVIRRITLGHAEQMYEDTELMETWPATAGVAQIIAETDGGMIPIMEPDMTQADQRKGKLLLWKEVKIALAYPQGSRTLAFGGTVQGDAQQAGRILFDCACRAGFGPQSQVHALGDGASWIVGQVEERFGANGRYLVDFWHVCDYLGAAAKAITATDLEAKEWREEQKERLKSGQVQAVLEALLPHQEAPQAVDEQAPVRACHRYLNQRRDQLHYDDALRRELPIGSGEIESAHRYLVQQRLKRPGAWWRVQHAEHMLALRLCRANRRWDAYWNDLNRHAA